MAGRNAVATIGALVVLTACGSSPGTPGSGGPRGTLSGIVVTGPTCPVMRVPVQARCRPQPIPGARVEITATDRSVTATVADAAGRFRVRLPYGTYLVATNASPLRMTTQQRVQVGATPATVRLLVDSGIR